jgi:pimeloyl-ACP methyl ester carboxylesterase
MIKLRHQILQKIQLLPNSTLYWIDKCGHAAMMEHPEEFNRLLEDWLTSHTTTPRNRIILHLKK